MIPTDDTSMIFYKSFSAILEVAWSPDGNSLACSAVGGEISLIDTTTGLFVVKYRSFDGRAGGLFFSPDSHRVAQLDEDGIEIWNVLTHERSYVSMNETREVVQELTEPSEKSDRSLYSWSPNGKQIAVRVYGSREDVTSGLALSVEDPKRRAGHEYYTLIQIWESESFWESHTPRLYRTLVLISGSGIGPGISCASWSPDGKILAIGQRTLVHLWQPQTERVVATYTSGIKQGPEDLRDFFNDIASIDRIYWSPDGLFLACVGHIGIEIWEISTGEKFVTYYEHISAIVDVQWLMEKETIVSVDQDDIHVWHFRDGRVLQKVRIPYPRGEEDSVLFTAALSPDLSALACAGYKGRGPLTEEVEGILWIWKHHIEGILSNP